MKFNCRNEEGIETSLLVLQRKKTVSRRAEPYEVGTNVPMVDENGKVRGQLKIISCESSNLWLNKTRKMFDDTFSPNPMGLANSALKNYLESEAKKEGFATWAGLKGTLVSFYGARPTFRIEFKLL